MKFESFKKKFNIGQLANVAKKSATVGTAIVVGIVVYKWKGPSALQASWTTNYEPAPSMKWNHNWDRRDPKSMVKPPKDAGDNSEYLKKLQENTPTASRHLLLIRHGQYFDNADNDAQRFLTSLGRAQAELTGQRLKQLDLPYTTLISSTMTRAMETAKLVHKHLPGLKHVTDDSIREGAPIPPEPPIGGWKPEPRQFFQDGARIESAFRKYFYRADPSQKEDSHDIIVCHANVIRYFVCRALQFPGEGWLRLSLANCSITLISIQPDGVVVMEMMGDHGHVPAQQISFG